MSSTFTTVSNDHRLEVVNLIRRLPGILTGRVPDEHGIAAGFRARVGYAIFSLIAPNFNDLGRGMVGADGTKWPKLSPEYLAYARRFGPGEQAMLKKTAGLGKQHRFAPAEKKGLLTTEQLKLWRRTYARALASLIMQQSEADATAHAAAIAWVVVKKAGAKTKLDVYGNREVQMLVDTGVMRGSLQPGTLVEHGAQATYDRPSGAGGPLQIFDINTPNLIIVGTTDKKAKFHHLAKHRHRKRRLWPSEFPTDWWNQILGTAISGLARIGELYSGPI